MKSPFAFVVACGMGSGVGQPSLSGMIDVGAGVAPHGPHGIRTTRWPPSGAPVRSSTTVPDAFVTEPGACDGVPVATGEDDGIVLPLPPPPQLQSVAAKIAPTRFFVNVFTIWISALSYTDLGIKKAPGIPEAFC
ncbi:MAG: hypothetical protein M3R51_05095 [Candidatus Eremiobacteraeota bacterium]|nr:hypothetical protein [Candidatus Eremiobacteraeota bacterium]